MQAIPRCDFHIHTKYLGCADATMEVPAILAECERLGVRRLAITDHLNTLDRLERHIPIKADIAALETSVEVFFAVELNYTGCDAGFAWSAEVREQLGFQFAIGGIHGTYLAEYDIRKMVDIQHRHHLKTCADPLVEVLVHPYWFGKGEFDKKGWPWFDTMSVVPERYARELGQAARETGTAIEINAAANLVNKNYSQAYVEEYIAFLSAIAAEGALFSLGSDAHTVTGLRHIASAWEVAARIGLAPDRIWQPAGPPAKAATRQSGSPGAGEVQS